MTATQKGVGCSRTHNEYVGPMQLQLHPQPSAVQNVTAEFFTFGEFWLYCRTIQETGVCIYMEMGI